MFDEKALKKTLTDTYADFLQAYEAAALSSTSRTIASLRPGTPLPESRLQSEEDITLFKATAAKYLDKAVAALQKARDAFDAEISAAPSQEAVNAISMLRLLDAPTKDELMAAHAKYGDNYLAHRALAELAKKHKYSGFPQDNVDELLRGFAETERLIGSSFNVYNVQNSAWNTESKKAIFGAQLDMSFPE